MQHDHYLYGTPKRLVGESNPAAMMTSCMETVPGSGGGVGDDEALRRDEEIESGRVTPMSHEEFVRGVGQGRRR